MNFDLPKYVLGCLHAAEPDGFGEWHFRGPRSYRPNPERTKVDGLGYVTVIEAEGGEGEGERAHMVFKVEPDDGSEAVFFRQDGSYASYDGFEWDGPFRQVAPREKTVTVYEDVKA